MDVQMETLRTYPPQKELLHTTVKTITECLLDFFSSKHPQFSDDDTYLFLEGVNQLHFNDCALEEDPTFCPISSISTCQCKLYLTRVLGDTEHDREQVSYICTSQACKLIELVMCANSVVNNMLKKIHAQSEVFGGNSERSPS